VSADWGSMGSGSGRKRFPNIHDPSIGSAAYRLAGLSASARTRQSTSLQHGTSTTQLRQRGDSFFSCSSEHEPPDAGQKGEKCGSCEPSINQASHDRLCAPTTGHSLGGALATLAAIDLRKAVPDPAHLDLSCYTFGAPRTGNHAFAHEYNELVPDTWGIINDQARRAGVHGLQMLCQQILLAPAGLLSTSLSKNRPVCILVYIISCDGSALCQGWHNSSTA